MFQLGMMTQDGDGGPKDDAAAKAWFEKAAALNHAGALERLGAYAEAGRAGPKDMTAAMGDYKKAAMGEEDAQAAVHLLRCPFTLKDKKRQGRRQYLLRRPGLMALRITPRTDAHRLKSIAVKSVDTLRSSPRRPGPSARVLQA